MKQQIFLILALMSFLPIFASSANSSNTAGSSHKRDRVVFEESNESDSDDEISEIVCPRRIRASNSSSNGVSSNQSATLVNQLNAAIVRTQSFGFGLRVPTVEERTAMDERYKKEKEKIEADKERLLKLAYPEYGQKYTSRPDSAVDF